MTVGPQYVAEQVERNGHSAKVNEEHETVKVTTDGLLDYGDFPRGWRIAAVTDDGRAILVRE